MAAKKTKRKPAGEYVVALRVPGKPAAEYLEDMHQAGAGKTEVHTTPDIAGARRFTRAAGAAVVKSLTSRNVAAVLLAVIGKARKENPDASRYFAHFPAIVGGKWRDVEFTTNESRAAVLASVLPGMNYGGAAIESVQIGRAPEKLRRGETMGHLPYLEIQTVDGAPRVVSGSLKVPRAKLLPSGGYAWPKEKKARKKNPGKMPQFTTGHDNHGRHHSDIAVGNTGFIVREYADGSARLVRPDGKSTLYKSREAALKAASRKPRAKK